MLNTLEKILLAKFPDTVTKSSMLSHARTCVAQQIVVKHQQSQASSVNRRWARMLIYAVPLPNKGTLLFAKPISSTS